MRALVALLMLLAACDPYGAVQRTDTIEAFEAYLAEHPDSSSAWKANVRLEELYLARARASKSLEDWNTYMTRFGKDGVHADAAKDEREESLFDWAETEMTSEAWDVFLREYPKARKGRGKKAREAKGAADYAKSLTFGPVRIEEVNMAEDPEGPKDGWGFWMDVTNGGEQTIETLWMRVHYLGEAGTSLGYREWPLVAPYKAFPVPVPESQTLPVAPGETRTWEWTASKLPQGWAKTARVVPYKIRFVEE